MEGISLLHSAEWNLHDQYPAPAKVDTQIVALGQIAGGNNGTLGEVNIYGGPKHLIRWGRIGASSDAILYTILNGLFHRTVTNVVAIIARRHHPMLILLVVFVIVVSNLEMMCWRRKWSGAVSDAGRNWVHHHLYLIGGSLELE
jgi:hypothetical protein